MNQELMDMAKQAGLIGMRPHLDGIYIEALEAFAKLVAAAERDRMCEQFNISKELAHEKAKSNETN